MEQLNDMKTKHHKAEVREFTLKIEISVLNGKFVSDGTEGATLLRKGQKVALVPKNKNGWVYFFTPLIGGDAGKTITVSKTILRAFEEIVYPTMEDLQSWIFDETHPETPLGNIVEPDGHDPYGWASWMLILGYA